MLELLSGTIQMKQKWLPEENEYICPIYSRYENSYHLKDPEG